MGRIIKKFKHRWYAHRYTDHRQFCQQLHHCCLPCLIARDQLLVRDWVRRHLFQAFIWLIVSWLALWVQIASAQVVLKPNKTVHDFSADAVKPRRVIRPGHNGAHSARVASFDGALRLSQAKQVGQPPPIAPDVPPAGSDFSNPLRDQRTRLPFQPQLPPELVVQPPTPETQEEYGQFIPRIIDPENVLNVLIGRPRILVFEAPPERLYIPDDRVARWDVISEHEVSVVGLRPGSTVLSIWVRDPQSPKGRRVLSYIVRVFEDPEIQESLEQIEAQINDAFPDSYVKLTLVRDRLLVKGEVKDAVQAAQILSTLAQIRLGDKGIDDVRETDIFIDRDRFVDQENAALRRSLVDPTLLNRAGIVNLLRIPGEQQVLLRVTVAEINRSAMRAIGADVQIGGGDVSFISLLTDSGFEAVNGAGNLLVNAGDFRLALNALRELNLARTLAEPNLVALNGRTAEFFSGDRVPLPAATAGFGAVGQGVRFDNVGVSLSFTPFIVDRDRVRLEIFGRVSALDDATGTTDVGGSAISNQNARTFQTTVDLREGQTMALAGLLLNTMRTDSVRVPFVGDLPVLGTLFSNDSETYSEQELVIIVTPELVHPLEGCETPPLPGADVFQPTDVEFYLLNRLESRRSQDYRSTVRTDWSRQWHYQKHCNDLFINGPTGHSYNCCDVPPRIKFDPKTIDSGVPYEVPIREEPMPVQRNAPEELSLPMPEFSEQSSNEVSARSSFSVSNHGSAHSAYPVKPASHPEQASRFRPLYGYPAAQINNMQHSPSTNSPVYQE